jgi:GrpB-like predicted nucleotidyltransferase (UPF0157 family)
MTPSPVTLLPYDPLWALEYDAEAARIENACIGLPIRLEHIGSTSVPGLSAKPVIDILAGVPGQAHRGLYIASMLRLGFEHVGSYGIPGRNYFRRGRPRSHHVHMVSWSSEMWKESLLFRDYLRVNRAIAMEYDALKREFAIAHADDKGEYQSAKGPFIQSVLRKARTEIDWDVYSRHDSADA